MERGLREYRAALIGDAVVAAGGPGIRRNDAAGQEIGGGQGPQHRVNGALLEYGYALIGIRQPLGDFIAIEIFGGLLEHREHYQPY
jgi:hypothetical protein